jgi:hypothetical protein
MPRSSDAHHPASRQIACALFAASFAAVYLQVALMKLTSVMFTPLSVFAILGVALLGYGAAGSVLASVGAPVGGDVSRRVRGALLACGTAVVPTILAVNAIDLPAGDLFGTMRGLPALLAVYALLVVPFFLIGLAVSSIFAVFGEEANRLYFIDLVGAGLGSAFSVASLPWLGGIALPCAAALVITIGALFVPTTPRSRGVVGVVIAAVNGVLLVVFAVWHPIEVRIAPDKHGPILSRAAKPGGLAIDFSRWSVFGRVDVTEPFATLPPQMGGDISPTFGDLKVEQRMLTLDGQAPAFFFRVERTPADMPFLAGTSQSVAYHLRPRPRVLVIGVGGGTDILIALHHGATAVTGVELSPVNAEAVEHVYADFLGGVPRDPRVHIVIAEGRNFVARDAETYDIIQLSGVDTGASQGAYGLGTMPESYIYTVEAMRDLLGRLAPGGVLTITRDLAFKLGLRLTGLARAALVADGLDPRSRIAVIEGKGWGWATVLVRPDGFGPDEVRALRDFAARYGFDLRYDPGAPDAGEFDRMVREGMDTDGTYDLRPSTDDWPFFFLPIRWKTLFGTLRSGDRPLANPLVFLLASLAALTVIAAVLIGLPLWRLRAAWKTTRGKVALVGYFSILGFGYMLVEVALMQRFTVFLGNPMLAVAVVLGALLVASGIGSGVSRRFARPVPSITLGLVLLFGGLAVLAMPGSTQVLHRLLVLPLPARVSMTVAIVGALGIPMGMPFPYGISRLAARSGAFIPWAWSVNAMTSVIASVASYFIGMIAGYSAMIALGAVLYAGALGLVRRL